MNYELHPLCTLLRELFSYDQSTGVLTRKATTSSRSKAGKQAGYKDRHGHLRVRFDGREHAVHRLIWICMTGQLPDGDIDHINGIRADNRWANLRCVSHQVNLQNRRHATAANKSGFLGVTSRGNSHMARIKGVDGKVVHLGSYGTPEQAHGAYLSAKRKLHDGCTL